MTQEKRLLQYLKDHGSINPMVALQELGIFRLAARVNDLRKSGVPITSKSTKAKNRFGETCRVATYYMEGKSDASGC